ncbi:MAG TPA: hypothetical protein VFW07_02865 [Parafilimonas sp.]|nr:hypothetical protein [Parafilimonas sp.]
MKVLSCVAKRSGSPVNYSVAHEKACSPTVTNIGVLKLAAKRMGNSN